jgi:hypothetical protein
MVSWRQLHMPSLIAQLCLRYLLGVQRDPQKKMRQEPRAPTAFENANREFPDQLVVRAVSIRLTSEVMSCPITS